MNSPNSKVVRRRSVFLGYAAHVNNKKEAKQFVDLIKIKNKSASHNVSAFFLKDGNLAYCNDDGEPSDTAGKPILNVIRSAGVFNVCVVVTRYFGGTLLGTGGLVEAYSAACKVLFEEAVFARCCLCVETTIILAYDCYSKIKFLLNFFNVKVVDVCYAEQVSVKFLIEFTKLEDFKNSLMKKLGSNFLLEIGNKIWQRLEVTREELEKLRSRGK